MRSAHPDIPFAEALLGIWTWWIEEPARLACSRFNIEVMLTEGVISDAIREDLTNFWLRYFAAWLEADGFEPDEAITYATLAISTLSGTTVDYVSTGDEARLTRSLHALAALLAPHTGRGQATLDAAETSPWIAYCVIITLV